MRSYAPHSASTSTAPLAGIALREALLSPERPATRSPGRSRAVELGRDLVDGADESAQQPLAHRLAGAAHELRDTSEDERSHPDGRAQLREALEESRERLREGPSLAVTPKNHAVTYKLFPELVYPYQGQVIDRGTLDVVRSVPTERRIELARRYQENLGQLLDTRA